MSEQSRELIAHLAGSTTDESPVPLDLLGALDAGPRSASDLATETGVTRSTVYRALDPLTDEWIVIKTDGAFNRTGLGAVIEHAFVEALDTPGVTRSGIAFIAASPHRSWILGALQQSPARKAGLAQGDETPSRTTVHRALTGFDKRGWVAETADGGRYTLTAAGDHITLAYQTLATRMAHALECSLLLRCCDETVADIPVAGLADAEVYEIRPATPDTPREIARELESAELDTFRGFMSVVSRNFAETGDDIIRSGTDTELIVTERVLYNLPTEGPYAAHVKRGLEARNFTLLVAPEVDVLPVALAILDGERVMLGPADVQQVPGDGPAGTMIGDDPALVEWCEDLYAEYRAEARTPARHVLEDLKARVSDAVSSASETIRSEE